MCSSMSSFSLCSPSKSPFLLHCRFDFIFRGKSLSITPRNPNKFSLSASIAEKNPTVEFSWSSWDKVTPDDYNGWAIEEPAPELVEKKGSRTFAVIGIGAAAAAVFGLLAYFTFSSKGYGFRLRTPFSALHGSSVPSSTIKEEVGSEEVSDDVPLDSQMPEESQSDVSEEFVVAEQKRKCIIVPFAVDFAQQEAVSALQKLKIIEDDARADELCTRREYARWFVRANSQLERSRIHRINPSAALCGSRITAFDDVGLEDPDFEYIQTLAEAGIIRSKLSDRSYGSNLNGSEKLVKFSPERFISRQDLITWKAKLEYIVMPGISQEMARKNIGFLDVKEISSEALPELFVDYLADGKSITRGVFGQSKRLQPSKPCTKAQAAVALTSGRMTEFIQAEILRLEAEYISMQSELKEVLSEILERGEIKKYWERQIEEERNRGLEVEKDYESALAVLEQEKSIQESASAELVKQRAALDCQEQLLSSLKEVKEMEERLCVETAKNTDDQRSIEGLQRDLEMKLEGLIDAKSILEAEIEALRILRSWVEDEARKSQARAKVLQEAERRWKWNS
ncbi:hypothetical protein ACS0TY_008269 [Phlomoides rotata]